MKKLTGVVIVLSLFYSCTTHPSLNYEKIELNENWEFSAFEEEEFYPAVIPGSVQMDLYKNNLIGDPFFEKNELSLQWIEEKNWEYLTEFEVDHSFLLHENISLKFHGLDTYANVYLNDILLLSSNNMFRTWEVPIENILEKGKNTLRIVFESPILHNNKLVHEYKYKLPSGNEPDYVKTKTSNFTRKAAYQYGWDWGPRFVTMGVWKPIELVGWNSARIIDAHTQTISIDDSSAHLETEIAIEVNYAGYYNINIDSIRLRKNLIAGLNNITYEFDIAKPKLWWVNNNGLPYLYTHQISVFKKNKKLHDFPSSFGVRTIELVNQPDSIGTSFFFKLNGNPIFIKGANYIPQDLFLSRVSSKHYEKLILAAKEANFNMLRVWGGGIYEKDIFYDLCDKYGILVWQDFMFSGSLYPDTLGFHDNIKNEVIQNVTRLRKHPCIAIWCGNNEIEVAWKNWGWQTTYAYTSSDSIDIWESYFKVFRELIPQQVSKLHPMSNYVPTSPLSNWGSADNFNHSSMHYWGVWHGRKPFESFRKNIGRFMVEYGFQSFPELSTLKRVMHDSSLFINSKAMIHRQKSYIGNDLIEKHIKQYFHSPTDFDEYLSLSQKTQTIGLQMAIESHINQAPHCMGTLFWQFNDCWPGPSWSIIDFYGNKKDAYTTIKNAYKINPIH